ncbi:myosin heavy chain kinase B [Neocloeon triangulifer]|uniref:myosin heavy chain kinase B n=1 Tax=Neocloeon triangulifer TaxID=2078957 RepID=UPI00286EB56C|nr:myosin heavy chain kinase B [Neocloeon triangulifer]
MEPFRVEFSVADASKHQGDVECIACHGDKVYSGGDDGVIKVWNQKDLSFVNEIKAHESMVYTLTVIGDNLYSASNDGAIKIWRLPSLEPGPTLLSHSEAVRKIKVLPSGDFISGDEAGMMQSWSGEASKQAYEPIGEEIWDLAVDSEGLVYTARDRDITAWFLKENSSFTQSKATLPGRAPICIVNDNLYYTSRDGMTIESVGTAKKKFEKVAVLKGHDKIVNCMTHSDKYLFTAGWDNHVRVWDLQTHKCFANVDAEGYLNALAATPNAVFAGGANGLLVKITPVK